MKAYCLVFLAGLTPATFAQTATNQSAVLSAPGGRYVYGQVGTYGNSQFMLDTQTGRLWNFVMFCEDTKKPESCRRPTLVEVKYEPPHGQQGHPLPPDPVKQAKQPMVTGAVNALDALEDALAKKRQ